MVGGHRKTVLTSLPSYSLKKYKKRKKNTRKIKEEDGRERRRENGGKREERGVENPPHPRE